MLGKEGFAMLRGGGSIEVLVCWCDSQRVKEWRGGFFFLKWVVEDALTTQSKGV